MLGLTAATIIGGGKAFAALPERRIAFHNVHTNERFDARYYVAGAGYDPQGLAEINHALRDWRTNEQTKMDPELIDLLVAIRTRLDVSPAKSFDLISGYRSPNTNAALRARGGAHTGVATKSQHMLGKATDIYMPGVQLSALRQAAVSLQRGGVGFYPRDNFVHVDTARVRTW
ncbi:MAG: DUF882 domain-containing protein [Sphingomonas fennica]